MPSRKAQCQVPPDNPETGDTYEYHSRERRSRAGKKIEHQNVHRRRSSRGASIYTRVYTSEVDFHKPGVYGGSVRVRADAWDVFRRAPSRGGRGRRAAVDFFRGVFFSCLVAFRVFLFGFFSSNEHSYCKYEQYLASCTSLLVMRQGRGSGSTEAVFAFREKKPLHTGVRTGCHCLIGLLVCVCV